MIDRIEIIANLGTIERIEPVISRRTKQYKGIYRVCFSPDKIYFIKNSANLNKPFYFTDEGIAKKFHELYETFTKEKIYHPDSHFTLIKQNKKISMISIMPELKILEENKAISKIEQNYLLNILGKHMNLNYANGDLECDFNYGKTIENNPHYIDMHIITKYGKIGKNILKTLF